MSTHETPRTSRTGHTGAGSQMSPLRVAIVGCGLIGAKRADAITLAGDELIACHDIQGDAQRSLAERYGCRPCATFAELLDHRPQVVVVATVHDRLAELAELALAGGAHVLVEKPAAISSAQVDRLIECQRASGRLVKVGFNHRFHPGLARVAEEVESGRHGELMHLRARYGHGGRPGYDREWRADPARSGGGELIDQGMHLLDLCHWLAGPLPLNCALLRTEFWDAPVEDNAALILGEPRARTGPWAMLHVSWTEWKNLFSLEVFCRAAKLQVDGLTRSYGPQRLRIYRMRPELGPPDVEELAYPDGDDSWTAEWRHFAAAVRAGDGRPLLGDLRSARYAWDQVENAYARSAA
ncbi:MAG TPA: Gfo/Idh/MocA family oxidoreductase [Solirubrobacteraceae bacterium]|jgi:predicted dehydrogenase|nr:Gfo/Idh/MocA family oxidoreductase [Solirubrobacteraceae bacterium]